MPTMRSIDSRFNHRFAKSLKVFARSLLSGSEMESLSAPLCRGEISEAARAQTAAATIDRARVAWLIAIFIGVLHAFMAVTAVNTKSPTFDEPQHLTAGYSFWVTKDFRLDPENGNLSAMWAALPLLFDNLKFIPLNDRGW